jgi:hypothetical protein
MPDWYELAYVYDIGPAQFVSFPRPLYPPDDPDGPSKDGPDVEAYKRIVSKLGRWPWPGTGSPPAPDFDQAFSNAFAHGKSSNVRDSGLEGVQRQAGVAKASGALGERTYDVLLYVRIPKGLDNAGQFACDDRAIALLQEAAKMFPKDKPADAPATGNKRQKVLDHLAARVGFTENPANSNFDSRTNGIHKAQDVTAGGAHWLDRTAWCGEFAAYALDSAGIYIDSDIASVAAIEEEARAGVAPFRGWTTDRSKVGPGDLVVIGGYGVHVETVVSISGSTTKTIGGNTSPGAGGSQSNGGGCYRRDRYPSEVRGFALVRYE